MSAKVKSHRFINYVIFGQSEPVPAESLTHEQKEKAVESLQDSFMASRGYLRAENRASSKAAPLQ